MGTPLFRTDSSPNWLLEIAKHTARYTRDESVRGSAYWRNWRDFRGLATFGGDFESG